MITGEQYQYIRKRAGYSVAELSRRTLTSPHLERSRSRFVFYVIETVNYDKPVPERFVLFLRDTIGKELFQRLEAEAHSSTMLEMGDSFIDDGVMDAPDIDADDTPMS